MALAAFLAVSSSSSEPLLVALIVAAGTGLPALAYTIWRGRKLGPKEEQELISRTSHNAVEMMDTVLTAAKGEREAWSAKVDECERVMREDAKKIGVLERRIGTLEGEVRVLRLRLGEPV